VIDYVRLFTMSVSTAPAKGYSNLTANKQGDPATDMETYQQLLRKLNWLVRASRPDIAFAVQKLSQFSHNPGAKQKVDTCVSDV
jgi:hypothetical protein